MQTRIFLVAAAVFWGTLLYARADSIWLDELNTSLILQGWGEAQKNQSVTRSPLRISGRKFEHGVGTHAVSRLWLRVAGGQHFTAAVGVDDGAKNAGSVEFEVFGDGRELWRSGRMKGGDQARPVDLDLSGIKNLLLLAADAGDGIEYDHADWADAQLTFSGAKPAITGAPDEEAVLLTPAPVPSPRVNGPLVYGCRPGNPFLYRIPCQGQRPLTFSASGLPASLRLDPASGIITGMAPERGDYGVVLCAENPHGKSVRNFSIVAGDQLALTPPMGFNDWYAYYARVTDADMRHAADVMIASGMSDVGYQYVNVDDCWMGQRDAAGNLAGNARFPDMKALADYIHARGLKAGLYTSPGPLTCASCTGTFDHEAQDARQFADWGFDFLKYDWCSYGRIARNSNNSSSGPQAISLAAYQLPYRKMGSLLRQQSRDLVFNLCQYGMGDVWCWGADVGGHCWRTAGDLGFSLQQLFAVALKNSEYRAWSRPGAWNDPDYIQIGHIGSASAMGQPKPCPLTPTEQYSFMSLWCLMAAPLFYSGDMTTLDEFTLNVLCNPEVIEVDQDPLGQSAAVARLTPTTFLMIKEMADGSKAVGLCNQGEFPVQLTAPWSVLGLSGQQRVRDLWRQKDLGVFSNEFSLPVPRHGVALLRFHPEK